MKYEELKDLLEEFISCEMTCKGWRDCEGCEEDINELINTVREVIEPEIRKQAQKEVLINIENKILHLRNPINLLKNDRKWIILESEWINFKKQLKGAEKQK